MTDMRTEKGKRRAARKAAAEQGDRCDINQRDPSAYTESYRGRLALGRWARQYDDLNGAPDSDLDR